MKKFISKFLESLNKLTYYAPFSANNTLQKMISVDEAMKILNLKDIDKLTEEDIKKQAEKYITINEPKKGGSFYIQNKVFYAKESLLQLLEKNKSIHNNINEQLKKRAINNKKRYKH